MGSMLEYDVTGVEGSGNYEKPKPGVYPAKVVQADIASPQGKDKRIEVIYEITAGDYKGAKLYDYINLVSEAAAFRLKDFIEATGAKEKGKINTDKFLEKPVQIQVRGETYNDEYQAKVRQVMPPGDEDADGDNDEDLNDGDDDDVDYSDMSLDELREECDERELSSKGSKKVLIKRLEESDEEEDDDNEDDDDEEQDYSEMSIAELKEEVGERELTLPKKKGSALKKAIIALLEEDDESEDDDDDNEDDGDDGDDIDYTEWDLDDLKAECESRGIKSTGRKAALIKKLEASDEEDGEPFNDE